MKIHNPVNYIAVPFAIIGIAGTAGCIEQGTSPVTAVLLMLLGFALYQNEGAAGRRSRRNKIFALLLAAAMIWECAGEGKAIDMYFPTLERCKEWMELTSGKAYVQLVYAEG